MLQAKNWLPDDALEGSDNEARSPARDNADRTSMELPPYAPGQPDTHVAALRQKVQRIAATPVRSWRRLLGLLALPCAFAVTALCAPSAAHAEQSSQRWSTATALRNFSTNTPQSSGYRDMLTRFASRQSTSDETRTPRLVSSYRDFANRLRRAN
jgi:hypothetical protein